MSLKAKFIEALEKAKGEREIHEFLKQEPLLVWATFMDCGGHSDYVIPEFTLGGKYRSDFIIMQSFSGGWKIAFVELEPVDIEPFKKKLIKRKRYSKETVQPSERLLGAIEQIKDWRNFEEDERATLRSSLADAAKNYDTLYPERHLAREPWCTRMPLRDPKTYLRCEYFVVMGRRKHFDENLIYEKSSFYRNYNLEILTYDRFVEVAEKLENQNYNYKNRRIDERDKEFLTDFAKNPDKYNRSCVFGVEKYTNQINVYGTSYDLQPEQEGFIVNILGTSYEVYEDRRTFNLYRIDPDGLGFHIADNLDSLQTAIQLAEIYERFLNFHLDTNSSLDLIDECLQFIRKNPPYRANQV